MKIKKVLKKIVLSLLVLVILFILGLIINNRIYYIRFTNADTRKLDLSQQEIAAVEEVYRYLNEYGDDIFQGFNGKDADLIIYNDSYEFLFSDGEPAGAEWTYVTDDKALNKNIYRRKAVNSQAFAVRVDNIWVGSFSTKAAYNSYMVKQIPIFFPPQVILADDQYYYAMIIHEMVHALEGKHNYNRLDQAEHIHDVCSEYYTNSGFNAFIELEAKYLEQAVNSEDTDEIKRNIKLFIETRDKRRQEYNMSASSIQDENEMEWLEGLARYAEYKVSHGSDAMIAKNLLKISEKAKVKSDDRYYTLGMAEYMVLYKINKKCQSVVLNLNDSLEELLRKEVSDGT